jgi:hypothetical protein
MLDVVEKVMEEQRIEVIRQMRERASFADTSPSLVRLLCTWADVLEGKTDIGWASRNREDLENSKETK